MILAVIRRNVFQPPTYKWTFLGTWLEVGFQRRPPVLKRRKRWEVRCGFDLPIDNRSYLPFPLVLLRTAKLTGHSCCQCSLLSYRSVCCLIRPIAVNWPNHSGVLFSLVIEETSCTDLRPGQWVLRFITHHTYTLTVERIVDTILFRGEDWKWQKLQSGQPWGNEQNEQPTVYFWSRSNPLCLCRIPHQKKIVRFGRV